MNEVFRWWPSGWLGGFPVRFWLGMEDEKEVGLVAIWRWRFVAELLCCYLVVVGRFGLLNGGVVVVRRWVVCECGFGFVL
ncbi:hypothetical protein KY284_036156 [Solanum tuberosum]|nr:hypothetical protein KY284_036156 [Solanum tuberosum]